MTDTAGAPATTESTLSNWIGPYVTDTLGRADALSDQPYTAYTGPLTAGASDLQTTGFGGYDSLWSGRDGGSFDPTAFTSGIESYTPEGYESTTGYEFSPYGEIDSWTNPDVYSGYMSPFIQEALYPIMDETRRQSDIDRLRDTSRMTQAGAYGGSRQAIMESERTDNTARLLNEIYGTGMQDAYESGRDQFNVETDRDIGQSNWEQDFQRGIEQDYRDQFNVEQDRGFDVFRDAADRELDVHRFDEGLRFDASEADRKYGLDLLNDMMRAGAEQRGIDAEGIAADKAQFEEERDYPYRMNQYRQSMWQGLPVGTNQYSYMEPSGYNEFMGEFGFLLDLMERLRNEGGGEG